MSQPSRLVWPGSTTRAPGIPSFIPRPGTPIVLVTPAGHESEAKVRLARIGFDDVVGALGQPTETFVAHPDHVARLSRLTADNLERRIADLPELVLIDVRNPGEVALGSIPGARHLPLPALLDGLEQLDRDAPTVVFCAGGYRSAIAISLLRAHRFADVSDLLGGYTAWTTHTAAPSPIAPSSGARR